jgi:RHS repeat-associated protein
MERDEEGRIIEKTETVAGQAFTWAYNYDEAGRLAEARLDGNLVCKCEYDREGRRSRDLFPVKNGNTYRKYEYHWKSNRLVTAGNNRYTHDDNGSRSIMSQGAQYTTYQYAPDHRLLEVHQEDSNTRFTFDHDENGQRITKYRNGDLVEAYKWRDLIRLAGYYDGTHVYEFGYEENARIPFAMRRDDGRVAYLFYDQVGSLRVVADVNGIVIKEILYDPFGSVLEDTNPSLSIPLGFAGGLLDRDIGFVRFGWRDYDPHTVRWTTPDPMGDAGGDLDWYGYCLDDPVNGVDPLGLVSEFGPGYDGTSGSGYAGVGGNNTVDSNDSGEGGPSGAGGGGDDDDGHSGKLTQQNVQSLKEREKRKKTSQQMAQEMEEKAKEQAKRDRRAAEKERKDRQRRRAAGMNIATKAVLGAAGGAMKGAVVGSVVPGVGTLAGGTVGGIAGFTNGLFTGTLDEARTSFDD